MTKIYIGSTRYPQRKAPTLRILLENVANLYPDVDAYIYRKESQAEDYCVSYRELHRDVRAIAAMMLKKGLTPGHLRFAVIGENSYPWVISYNASISYLGVAVPLDAQLPVEEGLSLLERGKVDVLFFSPGHRELAEEASKRLPRIKFFVSFATDGKDGELSGGKPVYNFWKLLEAGRALSEIDLKELLTYAPSSEDLASIVFTSGTTSNSKGVMLSHRNISTNAHAAAESFDVRVGDRCLSVLPLHHTFENTVGMYAFWYLGLTICINDGLRYIAKNLHSWRIDIMMAVPAIAENIKNQIERALRKQNLEKKFQAGLKLSKFLLFFRQDKRRNIFKSILDQLGGNLHLMVCGGAAVDSKVVEFFNSIGICCLPGYGLSEAAPVLSCNLQDKCIPSSVGWPLPGVSLKIDNSDLSNDGRGNMVGEVMALGDNIMLGYLENEEATRETISADGWLRTGDLGYFDEQGALHLTGRKKSMLVLSNGKKAFAEEIEMLLKAIPGVKESFVWDEESKRGNVIICAKMEINRDDLPLGKDADDEEISHYLHEAVLQTNNKMPVYKAISAFIWSEEPLIMTTTLKVKRHQERARIAQDLDSKGLSIQEASGLRIPAVTDIHIIFDK